MTEEPEARLARVVGVPGAVLLGLGSILGTGIFVSIGIAADVAGPAVVLAVALAALVATFNGLSSAQLAAAHPVSGGTYEYGYRVLHPTVGFLAGWMFLCAKSASAATAALGLAGYVLAAAGIGGAAARIALALAVVAVLTLLVAGGMQRSNRANTIIVSVTLAALAAFVVAGAPAAFARLAAAPGALLDSGDQGLAGLLHATALMFVAYTGYGRIATLGEEVKEPEKIPRAVILALAVTMVLYVSVTAVAVGAIGADGLAAATRSAAAPLEIAARRLGIPAVSGLIAIAAVTAMAGVLLNLLLGLSRVLLAMGRRGDMPAALAALDPRTSPRNAVLVTGAVIAALVLTGSVKMTWSFSAFTVLIYYALTNLAAPRLPAAQRRFPSFVAWLGLASCLGLAFWVERRIWGAGLLLTIAGLAWRALLRRRIAPASGA